MEFRDVIKNRKSCRHYTQEPVSRSVLQQIVEAGLSAPNSCNLKIIDYIIIDDRQILETLTKKVSYKFAYAPTYIILLYNPSFSIERAAGMVSLGMSAENILLETVNQGLAGCAYAGFSKDDTIKRILNIPHDLEIALLISIGFPDWPKFQSAIYTPKFDLASSFNQYSNQWVIKKDIALQDWTVEELVEYRKRISSVYLDRFRLHTFRDEYYTKAFTYLNLFIKNISSKKIFDLLSYDGFFAKTLHDQGFQCTVSDYIEENTKFLSLVLGYERSSVSFKNIVGAQDCKYDVVTFIYQIDFTPRIEILLSEANRILVQNGHMYITFVVPNFTKRIMIFAKQLYRRIVLRKPVNVYEGNPFYKIGPRCVYSKNKIIRMLSKSGFRTVNQKKESIPKEGVSLYFLLVQKL